MPRRFAAIDEAISKAGAIVQQLSHFMRHAPTQRQPQDLGAVILGVEGLLCQAVGGRVQVTFRVPKGLRRAEIDAGQIEQILLNLAVNARDAMEQSARRELVFSLAESTLLRYRSVFRPEPTSGTFLMLSVEDSGCGIPPEQQVRIFSPFFTTKPEGRGTGLGLASVLRLMQQHSGWVEVESAPGRGACFRLYFPTIVASAVEAPASNVALAS
jgi:signal transduction histidine kinase